MRLFDRLFPQQNPEREYKVDVTATFVRVEHPRDKPRQIQWSELKEVKLVNTDEGPLLPDVWLTLLGDAGVCRIPQGAEGYSKVFEIVSAYEGFDFENVIRSMGCTDNAEFSLWKRR